MRLTARPLAAAAAAVLLGLVPTACGTGDGTNDGTNDGTDDGKATADPTPSVSDSAGATDGGLGAATDGAAGDGMPASPQPADSALCSALSDIIEVVDPIEGPPAESQWDEVQDAYAALGEAELPAGTPTRQREGRDAAVRAITSLSHAEAQKAFGDDSGEVPGLDAEENAKAAEFFTWAGRQCPSVLGTADAEASSVTTR